MKEIQTSTFYKKHADLITHPPVPGEEPQPKWKKKKKKKLYQLNREVDDVQEE